MNCWCIPIKAGNEREFPSIDFSTPGKCFFESFIKIKKLNGQGGDTSNNKIIQLLKKCIKPTLECDPVWLL
jgi:hypothetical protein